MTLRFLRRAGQTVFAALTLAVAVPLAGERLAFAGAPDEPETVRVTAADVRATNDEVRMAYGALTAMWTGEFGRVGGRFAVPRIARYRAPIETRCGVMYPGNAGYCPTENAIYYDDVFVAAQGKRAASRLGTDGDMAAVGVIAHEVGHAVAMQLGFRSRVTYENEAVADCLTGAFARFAGEDGSLEEGDLDEAFFAMASAADPTPTLTGDERRDRARLARLARSSHGSPEQRMENFDRGLQGGAGACLDVLQ